MNVATIKIVADNEQGFIIINESDKKESDVIFDVEKIKQTKPASKTKKEL